MKLNQNENWKNKKEKENVKKCQKGYVIYANWVKIGLIKKWWIRIFCCLFVIGDSKSEEVSSCYMHLPFLNDCRVKKEDNKDDDEEQGDGDNEARVRIDKLPDDSSVPEPHYTQPYAEAAAVTVAEKTLDFIPPSHLHVHNYIISLDDSFPIVVREAQSAGSSMEDEWTKSMTGVLRVLNTYNHTIDVIAK